METHAFDFRLRANAPEGQKRFSIRTFPLRAMPVFRHSLRWLTPLLAVLMLLAARPAAAITRHDGTRPRFEESLVSKLPKDQQAMWKWVASGERGALPFSGVLVSDCHILTCAHAFFENASEGTGKLTADPKTISFSFPDPADALNEKTPKYQAASVSIPPEFMERKDDGFYGKGHRKVGYDLAIVTLEKCVPDAKPYRYNDGTLIKDERDEKEARQAATPAARCSLCSTRNLSSSALRRQVQTACPIMARSPMIRGCRVTPSGSRTQWTRTPAPVR